MKILRLGLGFANIGSGDESISTAQTKIVDVATSATNTKFDIWIPS